MSNWSSNMYQPYGQQNAGGSGQGNYPPAAGMQYGGFSQAYGTPLMGYGQPGMNHVGSYSNQQGGGNNQGMNNNGGSGSGGNNNGGGSGGNRYGGGGGGHNNRNYQNRNYNNMGGGNSNMGTPPMKRARVDSHYGNYQNGPNGIGGGMGPGNGGLGGNMSNRNIIGGNMQNNMQMRNIIRRACSDFRISKIKIGDFEISETKEDADQRDSRLRFYFRNITDPPHQDIDINELKEKVHSEPDRISISMDKGRKRMVIPIDGIQLIIFSRREGHFLIKSDGWAAFEEIDSSVPTQQNHAPTFRKCPDLTKGELAKAKNIEIWLNKFQPLPEPKWARGNLKENIDPRSRFRTEGVLQIADAEVVSDFRSLVSLWSRESSIGTQSARVQWINTYLYTPNIIFELASKILAPPFVAPLNNGQYFSMGPQATPPLTQAINELLNQTREYANQAGVLDADFVTNTTNMLFLVPENTIWRALDGLFAKEQRLQTPSTADKSSTSFNDINIADASSTNNANTNNAANANNSGNDSEIPRYEN